MNIISELAYNQNTIIAPEEAARIREAEAANAAKVKSAYQTSAVSASWGEDTVSISEEGKNLAAQLVQEETQPKAEEVEAYTPLFLLKFGEDREYDLAALMKVLEEENPELYDEIMKGLLSGDSKEFVQAIARLTGEDKAQVVEVLNKLSPEDGARFAKQLAEITGKESAFQFTQHLEQLKNMPKPVVLKYLDEQPGFVEASPETGMDEATANSFRK